MKKKLIFAVCALFIFSALPGVTYASVTLSAPPNYLGLVGYWPFDSATTNFSTGETADLSGNNNTGVMGNMTAASLQVSGKLGQALKFDGINQFITVGINKMPNINAPITIALWTYYSAVPTTLQELFFRYGNGGYSQLEFRNGVLQLSLGGGGAVVQSSVTPSAGVWHHIVYTYDGTNSYIYVDGVETGHSTNVPNSGVIQNAWIGGWGSGNTFQGSMDDFRVYSRALSATEISQMYQQGLAGHGAGTQGNSPTNLIPNGLVGYWTFDGQNTNWTANTTADVSGKGNTGTLVNMSPSTSPVLGRFGQALSFNSNGQEVSLANPAALPINTNSSVAFWYKSQPASYSNVYNVYNGSYGWEIQDRPSGNIGIRVDTSAAGNQVPIQVGSVNDGKWHDVVVTYTASTEVFRIYVNGVLVGTTGSPAYSGTLPSSATSAWIGGFIQSPEYIDDVRIYNRALSATEVRQLYNAGAVGTTVDTAPAQALSGGGLVGYWPFDGSQMNWASNLALDGSGSGNNGTLVNMTPANAVMGVIGQALSFNGTNQYVSVPYAPSNSPTSVTLAAWVRPPGYSGGVIAGKWYTSGVWGYYLTEGSNFFEMTISNSSNSAGIGLINSTYRIDSSTIGKWVFVVGSYDAATGSMKIYINGTLDGSLNAGAGPMSQPTSPFSIGATYDNGYYRSFFTGSIDDVRLYNRALSATEVKQLYNLGK